MLYDGGLPSIFASAHADAEDRHQELEATAAGGGVEFRPLPDVEYQRDCFRWLVDVLRFPPETLAWSAYPEYAAHSWDGTRDPLKAVADAVSAGMNTAVESATGTGKTYLAAGIVLWFLACFEDGLTVTLAPKEDQLTTQLWRELGRHWEAFRRTYGKGTKQELRVRVLEHDASDRDRWVVIGWACGIDANDESAARAQGFHAKDMLIVTEETPGIPQQVMAALQTTSVGEHNLILALGNPNHQQDTLHQFAVLPGTVHVRISAYDHPNVVLGREVIPGATSRKGIRALADKWMGEDTAMFKSRARGISPEQSAMSLIQAAWMDAAFDRYENAEERQRLYGHGYWAVGLDAAQSENGDQSGEAWMRGAVLEELIAAPCPDANVLGTQVFTKMKARDVRPEYVGVDAVGVGAGTYNELNRLVREQAEKVNRERKRRAYEQGDDADTVPLVGWRKVQGLYGGAKAFDRTARAADGSSYEWAPDGNIFDNLRSQMYWQFMVDVRDGTIAIARNAALKRQATQPTWTDDNGKVCVESKKAMRKRLGVQSPNELDAAVYANWVRRRSAAPPPPPPPPDRHRDTNPTRPDWMAEDGSGSVGHEYSTFSDLGAGF